MIKPFIRRHRLVALPLMMIMGGITFPQTFSAVNTANSSLPSQPVVTETVRIDQGVRLRWLPSQPGQHAISGYISKNTWTTRL